MIYMRMAVDELVYEFVAHVGDIEFALLLSDSCVEAHVQQHVAKLLADVRLVVFQQSVAQFVSFFYGIRAQRLISLLAVPRAFLA